MRRGKIFEEKSLLSLSLTCIIDDFSDSKFSGVFIGFIGACI